MQAEIADQNPVQIQDINNNNNNTTFLVTLGFASLGTSSL